MRTRFVFSVLAGILLTAAGCGGGSDSQRTDFPQRSPEADYAESVRQMTNDLERALQSEGLSTVETESMGFVETMATYEDEPVGEHKETYKKIYEGGKELQSMFKQGSASEQQVRSKIEELQSLAEKLPQGGGDSSGNSEG